MACAYPADAPESVRCCHMYEPVMRRSFRDTPEQGVRIWLAEYHCGHEEWLYSESPFEPALPMDALGHLSELADNAHEFGATFLDENRTRAVTVPLMDVVEDVRTYVLDQPVSIEFVMCGMEQSEKAQDLFMCYPAIAQRAYEVYDCARKYKAGGICEGVCFDDPEWALAHDDDVREWLEIVEELVHYVIRLPDTVYTALAMEGR